MLCVKKKKKSVLLSVQNPISPETSPILPQSTRCLDKLEINKFVGLQGKKILSNDCALRRLSHLLPNTDFWTRFPRLPKKESVTS